MATVDVKAVVPEIVNGELAGMASPSDKGQYFAQAVEEAMGPSLV
jgi:hypothetical protein